MPGRYLHRSDPSDVARTEHLTFHLHCDCGRGRADQHWMSPGDADKKVPPPSRAR